MENFDSLFSNQQQCSEQPFDKKQWAQQKQEKRQELLKGWKKAVKCALVWAQE